MQDPKRLDQSCLAPSPETPAKLKTNLNIGCEVEVKGLPDDLKYGVVRWLGVYNNLRIVGLTMVGANAFSFFSLNGCSCYQCKSDHSIVNDSLSSI